MHSEFNGVYRDLVRFFWAGADADPDYPPPSGLLKRELGVGLDPRDLSDPATDE